MRPSRVIEYLVRNLQAPTPRPVLLAGPPGVGKSSLCAQALKRAQMESIVTHLVYKQPQDLTGLPWPDKDAQRAIFLPIGDFARVLEVKVPTGWVLDDMGQAIKTVQACAMPLLLDRRANGHELPEHVRVLATTNRAQDLAGVTAMLEPVKSRFLTIIEVEPCLDDTLEWAVETGGYCHEVIGFLRARAANPNPDLPNLFCEERPAGGMANGPNPRTWENASNVLRDLRPEPEDMIELLTGAVGPGAAAELAAYMACYKSMVSVDHILSDPGSAPLPDATKPDQLFALSAALAFRTNSNTFDQVEVYLRRMYDGQLGPYVKRTLDDATRRRPDLVYTETYTRIKSSPLGRLGRGEAE